jgi:hypothetical protein
MSPLLRLPLCAAFALFVAAPNAAIVAPAQAQIGISVSVGIAPPLLPVYAQPPIPGPGYIWTPGYWAWNGAGYYWVPGAWVLPPRIGVLWTPGYWGWSGGAYVFNPGYWGPTVGFYGGINYGFGYGGSGFAGGYWNNGAYNYNTAVTNVGNTHIGNTYNAPVTVNRTTNISNVSYNGQGGTTATPTPQQAAYAQQQHIPATAAQVQHQQAASNNPALSYAKNKGTPPIGATPRPGAFQGPGVTAAKPAAPLNAPANRNASAPGAKTSVVKTEPAPQVVKPGGQNPKAQGGPNAAHPEERPVQHAGPGPAGPHAVAVLGPHPGPRPPPGPHPAPHPQPQNRKHP